MPLIVAAGPRSKTYLQPLKSASNHARRSVAGRRLRPVQSGGDSASHDLTSIFQITSISIPIRATSAAERSETAMQYVYSLPDSPSFKGRGLSGYSFGPLKQKDLDIYYVEVKSGHDTFMVSRKITRTYYVLSGSGYFTIDGRAHDVGPGMLAEIPPGVEYSYSGTMKLIIFSKPRWFSGNDKITRWNSDVVTTDSVFTPSNRPWLDQMVQLRFFGKSPVGAYLRLNQQLWNNLPSRVTSSNLMKRYGELLHKLARAHGGRAQAHSTFFLRNRPMLELIQRLAERSVKTDALRVAVLGCSTGAEVYSVVWKLRSAQPGLKLILHAVDISSQAVEVARTGVYLHKPTTTEDTSIFERMSDWEIEEIFDRDGETMIVKPWLREGIVWHVADVGEPSAREDLGPQDIVIANNFLCHMDDSTAETCLRNIAQLLASGGYLLVSGVNLDVRTRVADALGWSQLQELLEEIHEGDPCMRRIWPCHYVGLEPLNKARNDWTRRYAVAFEIEAATERNRELASCGNSFVKSCGV